MTRRTLLMAGSALALACGGGDIGDPTPAPPPPPSVGLFGVVESQNGLPISGAKVDLHDARGGVRLATFETGENGLFSFPNIKGQFQLRVWKAGFGGRTLYPIVLGNVFMRIALGTALIPGEMLILGDWISSSVPATAPPCDPEGWDAAAPCHRFGFQALQTGTLVINVAWVGDPPLDILLLDAGGAYLAYSDEQGVDGAALSAPVLEGEVYEVRVHSYYGSQAFQLKAELVP